MTFSVIAVMNPSGLVTLASEVSLNDAYAEFNIHLPELESGELLELTIAVD